jgi:Na+-driven multidrug efflux pump
VTNIYVSVLRVRQRLRVAAALNVGIATMTLSLAWVLLPEVGIQGAGWAWLVAQSAGALFVAVDILLSRRRARGWREAHAGEAMQ